MKRFAIILSSLVCGQLVFAQGTLVFLNTQTGTGTPGGAPVTEWIGGPTLAGTGYWAQLYASPTQSGTYTSIGVPVNFRTGAAAGFVTASTVNVPWASPGDSVWIEMRAWEGAAGTTYEWAVANNGHSGFSNRIQVGPLGGPDPAGGQAFPPAALIGLQPFSIISPLSPPLGLTVSITGFSGTPISGGGVTPEGFRFWVIGYYTHEAVYEACEDLTSGQWLPIGTNMLTSYSSGGSWVRDRTNSFTDADWTNHPARVYRARYLYLH